MEKSTKKKLGILLGAALTCLLLVAYAVSSIDTARLAKFVAAQVKASTGRDLSINGPVSIKVFPRLAGQQAEYVVTQLKDFGTALRPHALVMRAEAQSLSQACAAPVADKMRKSVV